MSMSSSARSPVPHSTPASTISRLTSPSSVGIAAAPCTESPVTISAMINRITMIAMNRNSFER